jgi:hypothetical protein
MMVFPKVYFYHLLELSSTENPEFAGEGVVVGILQANKQCK